jgi:DNA polymerase-3 subunit delta'
MQFNDVVGQNGIKQNLINGIKQNKLAHAYLFVGNPGFGSLPLALAFVQYIFCENRSENDSCGQCNGCRKTNDLQHPDLHFSFPIVLAIAKSSDAFLKEWREQVAQTAYFNLFDWSKRIDPKERAATIGSNESQEIIRRLSLKSYEGGNKVMLIWMADEMNSVCSNKLLKILEEPPEKTIFILIAHRQDKLLTTIVSRTQVVRIPKLEAMEMQEYLKLRTTNSIQDTESIVAQAQGDLCEALALSEAAENISENRELFITLMRVCYKKDVLPMLDWAEAASQYSKDRQKRFLEYALNMFRQSILKNYVGDQLVIASKDERDFLKNFSRFVSGNNVNDFMMNFNDAHYAIERNANPKILFTNLCFKVMRYIHYA